MTKNAYPRPTGRDNVHTINDNLFVSPFQAWFQINVFTQGVALGWGWVAPLGLKAIHIKKPGTETSKSTESFLARFGYCDRHIRIFFELGASTEGLDTSAGPSGGL